MSPRPQTSVRRFFKTCRRHQRYAARELAIRRYLASEGGRPAPGLPPGGSSSPGGGRRFRLGAATFGRANVDPGAELTAGRPDAGPGGAGGVPAIGGCGGVSGKGAGGTLGGGTVSRTTASGGRRRAGAASQAMYGIPARCVHWHAASPLAAASASGNANSATCIGRLTSTPLRECSGELLSHSRGRRSTPVQPRLRRQSTISAASPTPRIARD